MPKSGLINPHYIFGPCLFDPDLCTTHNPPPPPHHPTPSPSYINIPPRNQKRTQDKKPDKKSTLNRPPIMQTEQMKTG